MWTFKYCMASPKFSKLFHGTLISTCPLAIIVNNSFTAQNSKLLTRIPRYYPYFPVIHIIPGICTQLQATVHNSERPPIIPEFCPKFLLLPYFPFTANNFRILVIFTDNTHNSWPRLTFHTKLFYYPQFPSQYGYPSGCV